MCSGINHPPTCTCTKRSKTPTRTHPNLLVAVHKAERSDAALGSHPPSFPPVQKHLLHSCHIHHSAAGHHPQPLHELVHFVEPLHPFPKLHKPLHPSCGVPRSLWRPTRHLECQLLSQTVPLSVHTFPCLQHRQVYLAHARSLLGVLALHEGQLCIPNCLLLLVQPFLHLLPLPLQLSS